VITLTNQTTLLRAAVRKPLASKPAEFYELVESLCPAPRYLELFSRKTRPGWAAWGDEVAAAANNAATESSSFADEEFRYVLHHDVSRFEAEGWERLGALDQTHHGEYSALMRRIDDRRKGA
jgi:hypothetical protein